MGTRCEYALVLMTRAPLPGATKTRMMPHLTARQCAYLHRCMLRDISRVCACIACEKTADILVACDGIGAEGAIREAFDAPAVYFPQEGEGLGERMARCVESVLSQGYRRCAIIGSDSPAISADDIREAFGLLDRADAVIGPAADGGFYLMAMREFLPAAFGLHGYGHPQVMDQTIAALEEAGSEVAFLRVLRDLDTIDDARSLLSCARGAASDDPIRELATVGFLKGLL